MKSNMGTLIVLLTGIFTGAKLASAISWSWWLVFSPVLIYYGFWIAFWVIMAIISLTWSFIDVNGAPHKISGRPTIPHIHLGYFHDEKGGTRKLNDYESELVAKVQRIWLNYH